MSTPREIEFEDIREGDDIEVQWEVGDTLETRRGIAYEKVDEDFWYTESGLSLVDGRGNHARILLHHRPVLPEPEGLGAVVRTVEGLEYISVNRTPGTRRWVDTMIDDEHGERWALRWTELKKCTTGIEVIA